MYSDFECICCQKYVQCYFTYRTGVVAEFYRQFVICAKVYILECEWLILFYMEAANSSVNSHMEDQGWQFLLSVPKWC